jgi:hypothetical protein
MSDTPRTDAASRMAFSGEYMVPIQEAQKLERELANMTKQRDALAEALPLAMARSINRGYQFGHEDTVESTFVIVNAKEALDYFADDVWQMLLDGSQPEAQKALAATKGGSHE